MSGNAALSPRVLMAFGHAPLDPAPTWTDVSSRFRHAEIRRRLGDEGTLDVVLDNRDRALEPEYAAGAFYPDVVPNVRVRLEVYDNLIDHETASGETGMGWVRPDPGAGSGTTYGTVARSTTQAADGAWSFRVTGDASGTEMRVGPFVGTSDTPRGSMVPVVAGQSVTALASFRSAVTPRNVKARLRWYNSSAVLSGTGNMVAVASSTSGWTQAALTQTVPVGVAYANVEAVVETNTAGEVHYVDKIGLFVGTVSVWSHGLAVPFDGYIDSISPTYRLGPGPNGGDAVVTVKCTDVTKMLARFPVRPPYEQAVRADSPLHWWRFGEADGQRVIHDHGSLPVDAAPPAGCTLGQDPVALGTSQTSILLHAAGTDAHDVLIAPIPATWAIDVLIRDPLANPTGVVGIPNIFFEAIGTSSSDQTDIAFSVTDVDTENGEVTVRLFAMNTAGVVLTDTSTVVNLTGPIHVAATGGAGLVKTYLNGGPVASVAGGLSIERIFFSPTAAPGWTVRMGEAAIYDTLLSPAQVLAHANAARAPWEGDSTGERVARICADVGIPTDQQDIDTGATTDLSAQLDPVEGKSALDLARKAEETEFGRMFAEGDGTWRFASRRDLDGTAAVATFGDDGGSEIPYAELVTEFSEADIVRTSTVTRQGGNPQTYTDPAATAADAIFGEPHDGLLYATDGEAYDAAAWVVSQKKAPRLRFRQLTLQGERSAAVMAQVATRDISHKVTVRKRPPGGGSPQEKTVVIEGVSHTITTAPSWRATYELAPVDTTHYWILEDAVYGLLGSTTVLAF